MKREHKVRINSLTGIKILSLFAIFIWHCELLSAPDLGARACEILFICSGFCMAYNYCSTNFQGTIHEAIQFVMKRIKKFYILYIITMLLALFFLVRFKGYVLNGALITMGFFNIFLIQAWCTGTFNGASWFLSALLFCYFCTPFIISILSKCNKKKKIYLFIGVLFVRLLFEYIRIHFPGILSLSLHSYPLIRMIEYFLSCIAGSYFLEVRDSILFKKSKKDKIIFNALEVLSLIIYIYLVIKYNNIWYRGVYVFIGLILVIIYAFEQGFISKILSNKLILYFAKYEMEFFLWHQVIINFLIVLGFSSWKLCIVSFILTFIVSLFYQNLLNVIHKKLQIFRKIS